MGCGASTSNSFPKRENNTVIKKKKIQSGSSESQGSSKSEKLKISGSSKRSEKIIRKQFLRSQVGEEGLGEAGRVQFSLRKRLRGGSSSEGEETKQPDLTRNRMSEAFTKVGETTGNSVTRTNLEFQYQESIFSLKPKIDKFGSPDPRAKPSTSFQFGEVPKELIIRHLTPIARESDLYTYLPSIAENEDLGVDERAGDSLGGGSNKAPSSRLIQSGGEAVDRKKIQKKHKKSLFLRRRKSGQKGSKQGSKSSKGGYLELGKPQDESFFSGKSKISRRSKIGLRLDSIQSSDQQNDPLIEQLNQLSPLRDTKINLKNFNIFTEKLESSGLGTAFRDSPFQFSGTAGGIFSRISASKPKSANLQVPKFSKFRKVDKLSSAGSIGSNQAILSDRSIQGSHKMGKIPNFEKGQKQAQALLSTTKSKTSVMNKPISLFKVSKKKNRRSKRAILFEESSEENESKKVKKPVRRLPLGQFQASNVKGIIEAQKGQPKMSQNPSRKKFQLGLSSDSDHHQQPLQPRGRTVSKSKYRSMQLNELIQTKNRFFINPKNSIRTGIEGTQEALRQRNNFLEDQNEEEKGQEDEDEEEGISSYERLFLNLGNSRHPQAEPARLYTPSLDPRERSMSPNRKVMFNSLFNIEETEMDSSQNLGYGETPLATERRKGQDRGINDPSLSRNIDETGPQFLNVLKKYGSRPSLMRSSFGGVSGGEPSQRFSKKFLGLFSCREKGLETTERLETDSMSISLAQSFKKRRRELKFQKKNLKNNFLKKKPKKIRYTKDFSRRSLKVEGASPCINSKFMLTHSDSIEVCNFVSASMTSERGAGSQPKLVYKSGARGRDRQRRLFQKRGNLSARFKIERKKRKGKVLSLDAGAPGGVQALSSERFGMSGGRKEEDYRISKIVVSRSKSMSRLVFKKDSSKARAEDEE